MGENNKKKTYIKFKQGDNLCNNEVCKECKYFELNTKACCYMVYEGKMRLCGVGKECTKWRRKK